MFGSKLRSWMENHIVRPRKNRNKNKNGTSGNLATPNGHKGTSYQGDSTLGSPARRSEVSPIQNHTTSRVGWQLPQDNTIQMSPKSDHYPYRHMVKSTTSPKIVPHNKSSYSFDNTINNSNCSVGGNVSCGIGGGDNFSKSVDIKYNSKTMDYENRNCIKNGYQTSSSQQQKQSQQQQQQQHETFLTQQELKHSNNKKSSDISIRTIQSTTVTSSSSSSASILNIENRSLSKNNPKMMCNENHLSNKNRTDELKKKSTSSVIHQQQQQQQPQNGIVAGTTDNITELRPDNYGNKSNQLSGYDMSEIRFVNGKQKTVRSQNESKYGKILSTNRTTIPNGDSNIRHSNNNTNNCAKQQGVINTINSRNENNFNNNINNNNNNINNNSNNNNISNNTNNNNNNNNINNNNNNSNNNYQIPPKTPPQSHKPSSSSSYNTTNNQQNIKKHSSVIEQTTSLNSASVIGSVVGCKIVKNRNEIINNRNVMRTNRYSNCSTLSAPGHQSLSHMINTLSSPESAYSTGYSTDGTSPGASYTPEYYINIRTGTHYFPKAVGSVGAVDTGGNRLKYGGLNKIEETRQESIGNDMMHYHRRTESFDLGRNIQTKANLEHMTNYKNQILPAAGMSPILQKNLAMQNYKGIESPSPRQRCRIRTNPWFSNTDTSSSSITSFPKRNELDSGSTSSGIRSSSDAGTDEKNKKNGNKTNHISSDSETSSSTEKDFSIKTFSPNTIRRRKTEIVKIETKEVHSICVSSSQQESDEDATLNEMMGKFDESYVYEKETDILSDSDPTDCPSDLDTGQDAEDECDTDELLDIDYIDTGSIQEIVDKDIYKNTGSCSYHNFQQDKRSSRTRRNRKQDEGSSKRRKKLTRKKKSTDCNNSNTTLNQSPLPLTPRGCRSVGGTPVSLRRNQSDEAKRQSHMAPLTNRSNSLTFTEIHSVRSRVMAIAESEKALLRADLEADVKYKQLIHEAETILVSLKTNVRETPVASPRRVCNVPTNKRVEMLRNCEVDLKRELAKTQNPKPVETTEKSENLLLNKRLEILRFETASAPNSPKACRFSPRKTHVTNFMNQNASTTELMRRKSIPDPIANAPSGNNSSALSPRLQLNGRTISPPKSPTPVRRRFRSQSPKCYPDSSDSEEDSKSQVVKPHKRYTKGGSKQANKEPTVSEQVQAILSKTKSSHKKQLVGLKDPDLKKKSEITTEENYTLTGNHSSKVSELEKRKPPLMTFRSIDIGNRSPEFSYCPQSEPLKRKIYTCSSTFDKIQKSLDIESDIPKKALLNKISLLRKERRANKNKLADQIGIQQQEIIINPQETEITNDDPKSNSSDKRQLILDTIEDLKRSLEDQSVELYGLNDNEE